MSKAGCRSRASLRMTGLLLCLAMPVSVWSQTQSLQVDVARQYQTIDNFGASDCWTLQKLGTAWSEAGKRRLADLLFSQTSGIGLSLWRFNLGAGINSQSISDPLRTVETFELARGQYDWTRQAGQRWFLRAAKARGVPQFLAFCNSPPQRITRNGLSNCYGMSEATNLKEGYEQQFADYLADILQHFRDNSDTAERLEFAYVSPINEPQWEWSSGQEGNRVDVGHLANVNATLAATLRTRGLNTQVVSPESGSLPDMYEVTGNNQWMQAKYGPGWAFYGDFIWRLATLDSRMAQAMGRTFAYHSYWSDDPAGELIQDRQALRAELDWLASDWKLWQTEYCVMESGRDLGIDTALRVARVMHYDLTVVGTSAWQWWLAVSPYDYKDGLIYTDWHNPGDAETVYPSKTLWAVGQYSRFVRPGMIRVDLAGTGGVNASVDGVLASAYLDKTAGRLVVIYVNMGASPVSVQLAVRCGAANLGVKSFERYVTSGTSGDDLRRDSDVPGTSSFTLPSRSVTTLAGALLVPVDFDLDGDVDGDDLRVFRNCFTGTGLGPVTPACRAADVDSDGDVDLSDYGVFQRCCSGATIPADLSCIR